MKLAVRVKLAPSPEQAAALEASLAACNEAANRVSRIAFAVGVPRGYELHRHAYAGLKARGLGAQSAQHVIKKVREGYSALHASLRAGTYGGPGTARRLRAESKPIRFRPDAAQPFEERCLSWQYDAQTVSIWTTAGRLEAVPCAGHPDHLGTLRECRRGGSDLVRRDGVFYVIATCEVPAAALNTQPGGWIGVDLGIENIATLSTSPEPVAGKDLDRYRRRMLRVRAQLQANTECIDCTGRPAGCSAGGDRDDRGECRVDTALGPSRTAC
jgi:hypothetical protein